VGVTADVRVCAYVLSMPVSSVIVVRCAFVSSVLLHLFLLRASSLIVCVCALVLGTEFWRVIVRDSYMSSVSAEVSTKASLRTREMLMPKRHRAFRCVEMS
jgi:hypothetical protein